MGTIVPFAQITVGGVGAWAMRVVSIDMQTGVASFEAIDATGDTVLATAEINLGTGAGTMQLVADLMVGDIELLSQHFVAGDLVRRAADVSAPVLVVFGMSPDDKMVFFDPALSTGYPSHEYVRVAHIDPAIVGG